MTPLPADEVWLTVQETAQLLRRSPKTVRNLIAKHQLPRRIVYCHPNRRRMMLLSFRTRERLRTLCWGP